MPNQIVTSKNNRSEIEYQTIKLKFPCASKFPLPVSCHVQVLICRGKYYTASVHPQVKPAESRKIVCQFLALRPLQRSVELGRPPKPRPWTNQSDKPNGRGCCKHMPSCSSVLSCKDGDTGWFLPFTLQLAAVTLPAVHFASSTKGPGNGNVETAVHVCQSLQYRI